MNKNNSSYTTYNEIENIETLITQLIKNNDSYDYLFLDDNSPDKTYQVIEGYKKISKYTSYNTIKKLGIGSASRWNFMGI